MEKTRMKMCPNCQHRFSAEYEICPQCGRIVSDTSKNKKRRRKWIARGFMILAIVWLFTYGILLASDVLSLPADLFQTESEEVKDMESTLGGDARWTSIFA